MRTYRFFPLLLILFILLFQLYAGSNYQQILQQDVPHLQALHPVDGGILVVTSEKLLLQKHQAVQASLPLPKGYWQTVFSRNGNYVAVLSLQSRPELSRNRELIISVYTGSLQPVYSLKTTQYFDDPAPTVAVSDANGALVLGRIPTGEVWFYGSDGQLQHHTILFLEAQFDLERLLTVIFSSDGERVLVAATRKGVAPRGSSAPEPDAQPTLFSFSAEGRLNWQQELPGDALGEVALSPDGTRLAATSYTVYQDGHIDRYVQVLNEQGEELYRSAMIPKHLRFSPDSRYLLMAENQRAELVDVRRASRIWQKEVPVEEGFVAALALNREANPAALFIARSEFRTNRFVFMAPRVLLVNPAGETVQTLDFSREFVEHPALFFLPDSRHLLIGLNDNYQMYRAK